MIIASLSELHQAISTAGAGQIVELAPGEYRGPFIIDQPVTLRGQGRKTVVWRRAGPVIRVRAPGVKLERLLLERTVKASGPLIVYDVGCAPTVSALKGDLKGEGMIELDGEALVNLGDLIPGLPLSLPIRIETKGRAEIEVTGLHGAEVTPTRLDSPGTHTLTLSFDGNALQRGEVLLGELTLREGNSIRYLWVSGVVLDVAPPSRPLCLTAKKNYIHPSAGGFALDGGALAPLLAALGLGEIPAGLHALVQKDPMGLLYLYLPGEPPSPVLVNGKAADRQSRKLLTEGDSIQVGGVVFTVQPLEPPPIDLETPIVTFGDFDSKFPAPVKLLLRTGRSGWRGQVLSTVPWISVEPEGYYRLPPSRDHTWSIALNENVLTLDDGLYDMLGGLMIAGANHIISVDVRLRVNRPEVALQTAPLDVGEIELGFADDRLINVPIANLGRGDWVGELRSNVPWLAVATPMPFGGGPWSEAVAQVRIVPIEDKLTPGAHEIPDALTVHIADDQPPPPLPVPVRLRVRPAQGHLEVLDGAALHFAEVERNTPLPELSLSVRSKGGAAWQGALQPSQGWVQIEPEQLSLPPGASADVVVSLLDIPPDQPLDVAVLLDEIHFIPEAGSSPVPPVPVQLTVVERPPYLIARQVDFPPFVRGDNPPDATLHIYNMGPTPWQGKVTSNIAWISAPNRVFAAEPGETVEVMVSLSGHALDGLKAGLNRWEGALTVSGGREPLAVAAQIDLRDLPNELILETPTLNFGLVSGVIGDHAPETLRLLNAGASAWKGKVTLNVPWLSFEGIERALNVEIPKMSTAEFKIALNDHALSLPPGVIVEEWAVTIQHTEASEKPRGKAAHKAALHVRALLMVQEAAPHLAVMPEQLVLRDLKPVRLTVTNEGTRRWTLHVFAAPYLDVSPLPADLTLNPGQSTSFDVSLNHRADGVASDSRALVIVGPNREIEIAVEITAAAANAARQAHPAPAPPDPGPQPADAEHQSAQEG